jgi:hypothetical protein
MLDEESHTLRDYLAGQGVALLARLPEPDAMTPGYSYVSVAGGHVAYQKREAHPGVIEAVEALAAVEHVRRSAGESRVLAAVALGAALERTRTAAAFARAIHTGNAVRSGGKVGFARAHGPHAERAAEREQWRARFAELRHKFPEAPKKVLLGMIADETTETVRTLRRYIKQR